MKPMKHDLDRDNSSHDGLSGVIWPGFVDGLASLLMVLVFCLLLFVIAQFYLQNTVSTQDSQLKRLEAELSALSKALGLSKQQNDSLESQIMRVTNELSKTHIQLAKSNEDRDAKEAMLVDIQHAQAVLMQKHKDLSNLYETMANEHTILQQQAAELSGDVKDKEASINAQSKQINHLIAQLALLNAQLERLQQSIEVKDKTISDQSVTITDLTNQINSDLLKEFEQLKGFRSQFFGQLKSILQKENIAVQIHGDRFVISSEILFPSASDMLEEGGKEQLKKLADLLIKLNQKIPKDIAWVLRVDGHTDSRPISTKDFPSNWELSTARSLAVVKFLISQGVPPERLMSSGFGEYYPIYDGQDPTKMAQNRRIEFKLTQR